MNKIITYIFLFTTLFSFAQDNEKKERRVTRESNNLISEANDLASNDAFVLAEMKYRRALSAKPTITAGSYNLGHSYYKNEKLDEALYRNQLALKTATTKVEKHKLFHNIGNILYKNKRCKEAVDAYKNALRNNPQDNETRYNFALAKDCAEQQQDDEPQEENKDGENNKDKEENEDENQKENNEKEKEGDEKEDPKDEGEDEKKDGDKDKDEEGKPKDEDKKDQGKEGEDKKPKQQPGQLSPQQIKNLLEAMDNQEQKVQEKINAEKVKGAKVQTDKDW